MGQAKKRGSPEQRAAEAIARDRSRFPETVNCTQCNRVLTDIRSVDTAKISGLSSAGGAECPTCGGVTWIFNGTRDAVQRAGQFFKRFAPRAPSPTTHTMHVPPEPPDGPMAA